MFIAVFTTARIDTDNYTFYSRPVLILYSSQRLVHPRDHEHEIPPPETNSAPSFTLRNCSTVLLPTCNWRSYYLEPCEYHQYNYISVNERLETAFPNLSAARTVTLLWSI